MLDRAVNHVREQNPKLEFARDADRKLRLPRIKVTQAPKSTVFTLDSRDTNGLLAQVFLDALMDEFLTYKGEVRSSTSGGALASVSDQVYKEEQELRVEQDRLAITSSVKTTSRCWRNRFATEAISWASSKAKPSP